MDYNDNDYEGQNLHLTGEESSKVSVLRPFALPFDFDDSLHGHLRFDSLVENEVFLGIPSQEDNHWIEDFSRGGNGIEFSSSAAESCALPRHINVWSEATSSESVEMLLKSVGQEEMVPGESTVEESDPGDRLGSSTREMDSLREECKVDANNPLISPAEVQGKFSRLDQCAGVEAIQTERTLQVKEATTFRAGVDNEDSSLTLGTGNLNLSRDQNNENQQETCCSVNESQSSQMQENLSVPGKEIDNTERASPSIDVRITESFNKHKISNTSSLSTSCMAKGFTNPVEEQEEECNEDDLRLSGISVETDNPEKHCSHEIPLGLQSPKEKHAVETFVTDSGRVSSTLRIIESISTGDEQHSNVSDTDAKQLSGGHSILHETLAVALREGIEGFGIKGRDVVTPEFYCNDERKQDRVIQLTDQNRSLMSNDDLSPKINSSMEAPHSSLEAPFATCEPSMLPEVLHSPSKKDDDHIKNHAADGIGNSTGYTVSGECSSVKSLTDDAKCTAAIQKEKTEDEDHVLPPLLAGSIQTCTEDIVSMEVDAPESNLNVSAHEKESEEFYLDSRKIECDDNEKEVGFTGPVEGVTVEKIIRLQTDSSAGDYPVLNTDVEDRKLAASHIGADGLIDSHEHNPPPCDLGHSSDQNKESEFEAPKQPSPSIPKESFKSIELAPAIEIEKSTIPGSTPGEIEPGNQSISLLETSSATMPNEASKVLNEKLENCANASVAQEDSIEGSPTKKPMEGETKGQCGISSVLSVTSCTVEIDKSDKEPAPGSTCTDFTQSKVNKQEPFKRTNVENIGIVEAISEASRVNDPTKEGTFNFDIRHLGGQSTEDSGTNLQSFPKLQACKLSLTGEGSSPVSGGQTKEIVVRETTPVTSSTPGVCPPVGGLGGPSGRKSRRAGGIKSGKGSSKKGNLVNEASPLKHTEKADKSSLLFSPSGSQLMTFESSVKPKGTACIPTSGFLEVNTSVSSPAFFQQPFTDLQQVQLRAQIFVYGSLIQGGAPDEACMVSAFDGGRSVWERSWRACVDRLHSQKSQANNTGTPEPSRSGAKASDQSNRQSFPQSEVLSTPAGRASNKTISSPVVNPLIPLSSPLWSISTPSGEALPPSSMARGALIDYRAVSPLNPYQTSHVRNYAGHTTWSLKAPPAPFPVPWLSSSQSAPFEINTGYPTFPLTEPVKSAVHKESFLTIASGTKPATPILATHAGLTTMLPGDSPVDSKKIKMSTGQAGVAKTRKRKKSSGAEDVTQMSVPASLSGTVTSHAVTNQLSNKIPAVEDLSEILLTAQNQAGSMSIPVVGSYYSTSVAVVTPSSSVPNGSTNQAMSLLLPTVSGGHVNKTDLTMDKRLLKVEDFSKVEEAKLQAEEAAAHADAAISQCESVWGQLDQQKSFGLASNAESKLASAAVAVAAAASVAKAAAAAAKIASNAAVQAKQMAAEAVTMSGTLNATANLVYNSMYLSNPSPASILKGGDRNSAPSSAISAAREAARKRIEAASAAAKHAENLDAIVKAAELAAEAVAHAGKVVAMVDPSSLSALAEAGPYNYWKVPQKSNDVNKNKSVSNKTGEVPNVPNQLEGPDMDMHVTGVAPPIHRELSRNMGDHVAVKEDLIPSGDHGENSSKPSCDNKVSDSAKTAFVVSDPDTESRSNLFTASIEKGSFVEVLEDHGDIKKAWIPAIARDLKDGKVYVCYERSKSEGSKTLSEWISMEAKDGDVPKIRVPHPMTDMQFGITKKRCRAAVKDYSWSVGDTVDAWMQDCWCEGIVAEKNNKDATTVSVHFPGQGKTLEVKVWHLRPSLVWSDGQWIEWSRPRQDGTLEEDTLVEKRQKLGNTGIEAKGKAEMAKNIDFSEIERTEEPRLPLSADEKVFNIGSTREENRPHTVRTMRSGLEKEGSRVVFGVPKPGKKRKFMEVSKHYVSDRTTKTNVPCDSVKLAKLLVPQGSGSRGFRNNSKLDILEKQVADSKPRTLKSGKPPSVPGRTSRKDDATSTRHDASASDHSTKGSMSNDENDSSEQNSVDVQVASAGTMVFSSQAPARENHKKAARNAISERLNQRKLVPAGGRSTTDTAAEKLNSEIAEPRRSNRRIQPTSRLLEGLQSSLIISKIPSSHEKDQRTARGNNNRD